MQLPLVLLTVVQTLMVRIVPLLPLALLLFVGPLLAAEPSDVHGAKAERARIAAERKALAARFAAEERECRERFIVTACVDNVHLRRRTALAPLRERELQLDDSERRQRAADRKTALAAKEQAAAQRGPEQAPAPTELRVRKPPAAASAAASAAARAARHERDNAAREADAGGRVQAAAERQAAAQLTQERIAKRQAERVAKGKVAAPLPPFGTASAVSGASGASGVSGTSATGAARPSAAAKPR